MKLIRNWKCFLKNYLKGNLEKRNMHTINFLEIFHLSTSSQERKKICNKEISEQGVILAMKSFSNNKSLGNDGLTEEIYETFREELKQLFMNSWNQANVSKKLVTSQRQAVIKLLEKKDKDQRLISNWRPISLLNVDYKIVSKIFACRLRKYFQILSDLNKPHMLHKGVLMNQED